MLHIFLQLLVAIFLPCIAAVVHTLSGPLIVDRIGLPRLLSLQHSKPGANGRFGLWQDDSLVRIFFSLAIVVPHSVFSLLMFLSYSIRRPFNMTFAESCLYSVAETMGLVLVNYLLPHLLVYVCEDWGGKKKETEDGRKGRRRKKKAPKRGKRKLSVGDSLPPLPAKYTKRALSAKSPED